MPDCTTSIKALQTLVVTFILASTSVLALPKVAVAQAGQYVGQMHTTFQTGATGSVGSTIQNTVNVMVSIQPPYQIPSQYAQLPGTADKNPFWIFITQYDGPQNQNGDFVPGAIHIVSATPQIAAESNQGNGRFVQEHWALSVTGNDFKGEYLAPFSVDANNFMVSQETGNPLAWNPAALANGGNPFDTNEAISCIAFLSKPSVIAGQFDTANRSIHLTIEGNGGGSAKGICMENLQFKAEITATLDPTLPAPTAQLAP